MSFCALAVVLKYLPKEAGMEGFLGGELVLERDVGMEGFFLTVRELESEREAAATVFSVGDMLVKSCFGTVMFSLGLLALLLLGGDEDAIVGDGKGKA
jgi:hypothetical protein